MFNRTKIALAAALVIGTASAALAGQPIDRTAPGGHVMPGSLDGVNPAYHPGIFGNPAVARSYGFVQSKDGNWHVSSDWRGNRGDGYGAFASVQHHHVKK
jgi:hypothetical protein